MQLYYLSTDGRKLVLVTPESGTCFGLSIQPTNQTHQSFAECLSPSRIYTFNKLELEPLLSQRPAITLALLSSLEQRLFSIEKQLIDTTFKSVLARLASLLLQIAQAHPHEHESLVVTGLTHEELAERLGVYRETVSSALRELRDTHVIQLNRRRIVISSPERLASIAHTE
ncbi:hypothetical protein KSX_12640 [Ktedonospora formicarum]|uniref:HTH crp-type domain-containing protein n=1 Tax=Ktedonospora formicarum TaxID=2778364 RepID=A0A8J3HTQ2_9CHLR|nr:hypothetical protein KSX_12640 [Ktedonospora formicarum]